MVLSGRLSQGKSGDVRELCRDLYELESVRDKGL